MDVERCAGLLPQLVCAGNHLLARSGVGFFLLGFGGVAHGESLSQLGVDSGTLNLCERVALMHNLSLVDVEFLHASGHQSRHAHVGAVNLSLHNLLCGLDGDEAYDCQHNHSHSRGCDGKKQAVFFLAYCFLVLCFEIQIFHIVFLFLFRLIF